VRGNKDGVVSAASAEALVAMGAEAAKHPDVIPALLRYARAHRRSAEELGAILGAIERIGGRIFPRQASSGHRKPQWLIRWVDDLVTTHDRRGAD
jgi:hypothetical protein